MPPVPPRLMDQYAELSITVDQARSSVAALPPEEAARWIGKIDKLQSDCGCGFGARVTLIIMAVYPAVWYWLLRPNLSSFWYAPTIGVVLLFLSAGLGKLIGILIARYRLRLVTRRLFIHLREQDGGFDA